MPLKKEAQCRILAANDKKMAAIKILRESNEGMGLMEARDIVLSWNLTPLVNKPPDLVSEHLQIQQNLGNAMTEYENRFGKIALKNFIRGFLNVTLY